MTAARVAEEEVKKLQRLATRLRSGWMEDSDAYRAGVAVEQLLRERAEMREALKRALLNMETLGQRLRADTIENARAVARCHASELRALLSGGAEREASGG